MTRASFGPIAAAGSGYIYTNNDPGAAAITDARRLQALLGAGPSDLSR